MQENKELKVGDRIAWANAPSGAIMRDDEGDYALRIGDLGAWVKLGGGCWSQWDGRLNWPWSESCTEWGVIVALDIAKDADAGALKMYAKAAFHVELKMYAKAAFHVEHSKVTALQTAVAEIEAKIAEREDAARVAKDPEFGSEHESWSEALRWALEVLQKAGAT